MNDVINLQRTIKLDTAIFRAFSESIVEIVAESSGKKFTVAFISDDRMKQLNELFRGVDATTDVLSFPHEPDDFKSEDPPANADGTDTRPGPNADDTDKVFLGDIVISAQQAQKQAAENSLTLEEEIKQLILHGLLHLCGYDHETDNGEMNERELELREKLKI